MNVHAPISVSIDDLKSRVGQEVGVSSWKVIDQDRIDRFAAVTEDLQFIHVDPERALAETPFGGTIAHGFLTLSLLSTMGQEALPAIRGRTMGINYGLERVRFLSPVPVGARVRGRFTLSDVSMRSATQAMLRYQVTVEIEGAEKPALAAEWMTLAVLG
ncbi:MaoC family dehydratase [Microvirga sp. BSC39]|jgi:acyl dehydratase|uniref:MaoC family dehydratase n=1 Tax=Microvirga sp. BSC39 TaxID=1549810 RepID=UPI0004E94788|nr:MaoC family dehydratase [Microvirga sp. BSC39]KFG70110.1 Nodulation protein N [Microvirga sp. BSC39]